MARNYQLIHADKVESAKRQHDFNHHLKVMRELVREQKIGEMSAYLQSLLDVPDERKCSLSLRKRYY